MGNIQRAVASLALGLVVSFLDVSSLTILEEFGTTYEELNELTLGDEGLVQVTFPASFTFEFYGATFSSLWVSANGFISFSDSGIDAGCCSGDRFGQGAGYSYMIAPSWVDLDVGGSQDAGIYHGPFGTGDAYAIVFDGVPAFSNVQNIVSWELILYSSGDFKVNYVAMNFDYESPNVMTAGWQGADLYDGYTLCDGSACFEEIGSGAFSVYVSSLSSYYPTFSDGRTVKSPSACPDTAAERTVQTTSVVANSTVPQFLGVELAVVGLGKSVTTMWKYLQFGRSFEFLGYSGAWIHANGILLLNSTMVADPANLDSAWVQDALVNGAQQDTLGSVFVAFGTDLDYTCGDTYVTAGLTGVDTFSVSWHEVWASGCAGSAGSTIQMQLQSTGQVSIDWINTDGFAFEAAPVTSGFSHNGNRTTFCTHPASPGLPDCTVLGPQQQRFVYVPSETTEHVEVRLESPAALDTSFEILQSLAQVAKQGYLYSGTSRRLWTRETSVDVMASRKRHRRSRRLLRDQIGHHRLQEDYGYIWITQPSLETSFLRGTTITCEFEAYGGSGSVKIELFREDHDASAGGNVAVLASVLKDCFSINAMQQQHSEDVYLPRTLEYSSSYYLVISDCVTETSSSSNWFTVQPAGSWIQIERPQVGDVYYAGSSVDIFWEQSGGYPEDSTRYTTVLLKSGAKVLTFCTCCDAWSNSWINLPYDLPVSSFYSIRITSCDESGIASTSGEFAILEPNCDSQRLCTLKPATGTIVVNSGDFVEVQVLLYPSDEVGSSNQAHLTTELRHQGSDLLAYEFPDEWLVYAQSPGDDYFSAPTLWQQLPATLETGDYYVVVREVGQENEVYDRSDEFTVHGYDCDSSTLCITYPASGGWNGEQYGRFVAGSVVNIGWVVLQSSGVDSVSIQLYKGEVWIATLCADCLPSYPCEGCTHFDTVIDLPAVLEYGDDYRLRVEDASDPSNFDFSAFVSCSPFDFCYDAEVDVALPFVLQSTPLDNLLPKGQQFSFSSLTLSNKGYIMLRDAAYSDVAYLYGISLDAASCVGSVKYGSRDADTFVVHFANVASQGVDYTQPPLLMTYEVVLQSSGEMRINFIEGDFSQITSSLMWQMWSGAGNYGWDYKEIILDTCADAVKCALALVPDSTLVQDPFGSLKADAQVIYEEKSSEPWSIFEPSSFFSGAAEVWNLDFTFPFHNVVFSRVYVHETGVVAFEEECTACRSPPPARSDAIYSAGVGPALIAPFWSELVQFDRCCISAECQRSAGHINSTTFAVLVSNIPAYNGSVCNSDQRISFELILYESGQAEVSIRLDDFNTTQGVNPVVGHKGGDKAFSFACDGDCSLETGTMSLSMHVILDEYGFTTDQGSALTTSEGWNELDFGSGPTARLCANVELGFHFPFYNNKYSNIWVCASGFVAFEQPLDPQNFPDDGFRFGDTSTELGIPIIAPFWAALNPFPACSGVRWISDGASLFRLAFDNVAPMDYSRGSHVSFELVLRACGDFEMEVLENDFQMIYLDQDAVSADTNSTASYFNMTIGWTDGQGRARSICSGGEECSCLSFPLLITSDSGSCEYEPAVLSLEAASYSGAAGGDIVTLQTQFLDKLSEPYLRLRFTSTMGAILRVNVTSSEELTQFDKGIIAFITPQWPYASASDLRVELLYNVSNSIIYLDVGSTWNFNDIIQNVSSSSSENILLADGSQVVTLEGWGFNTNGIYFLALGDVANSTAEVSDVSKTCIVSSSSTLACGVPRWGDIRGPSAGARVMLMKDLAGIVSPVSFLLGDQPSFPVRPVWKSFSSTPVGSAGYETVTLSGFGFSATAEYSCDFEGLASGAVFVDHMTLQCDTPSWGDSKNSGAAILSIMAESALAAVASEPALREIYFYEEWSGLTQYRGTAKGGDRLAVLGYGFNSATDEVYHCVVKVGSQELVSDPAIYVGPKLLTCDTKAWQEWSSSSAVAEFLIVRQSDGEALNVFQPANSTRSSQSIDFEVFPETVEASISGSSSWGGETVTIGAYGLNPDFTYKAMFSNQETGEFLLTSAQIPVDCSDGNTISASVNLCVEVKAPRWVYSIQKGATVELSLIMEAAGQDDVPVEGAIKYTFMGYSADIYEFRAAMVIQGLSSCSLNPQELAIIKLQIATLLGADENAVAISSPYCSESRRRLQADLSFDLISPVTDADLAEQMKTLVVGSSFSSDLQNALEANGLPSLGIQVQEVGVVFQATELSCPCGSEVKESTDHSFSCSTCSLGFYSVDGQVCLPCSTGMNCTVDSVCIPQPMAGYWRSKPFSSDMSAVGFHECLWNEACLGEDSACADGYMTGSPICGVCNDGYYKLGSGCVICPSDAAGTKAGLFILSLSGFILAWAALVCFVKSVFKRDSLAFTDPNVIAAKRAWRKLKSTGALRQVVRVAADAGLRSKRRGSLEVLVEMPDGMQRLVRTHPNMQVVIIKGENGLQPVQIPCGMKLVTLSNGAQVLMTEGESIPQGAVASPRASTIKPVGNIGPSVGLAAKNIFTAAEIVGGMPSIVPINDGGEAGFAGISDAVNDALISGLGESGLQRAEAGYAAMGDAANDLSVSQTMNSTYLGERVDNVTSTLSRALGGAQECAETGLAAVSEAVGDIDLSQMGAAIEDKVGTITSTVAQGLDAAVGEKVEMAVSTASDALADLEVRAEAGLSTLGTAVSEKAEVVLHNVAELASNVGGDFFQNRVTGGAQTAVSAVDSLIPSQDLEAGETLLESPRDTGGMSPMSLVSQASDADESMGLSDLADLEAPEVPEWSMEMMADLSETLTSLSSKFKIIIGFVQIFSSMDMTFNIDWPPAFTKLANSFAMIDLNFANLPGLSLSCVEKISIYESFLFSIFTPVIITLLLYLAYGTSSYILSCKRLHNERMRRMALKQKIGKLWFWSILIVYPSLSRTILQMMHCKELDQGDRYLFADMSIDCSSPTYKVFLGLATISLLVYVIGIPVLIWTVLRRKRKNPHWAPSISFLFSNYEERFWWYEIYDLLRRLTLVGLILFFYPDSATQVAIGLLLAVFSLSVHLFCQAYVRTDDDFLQAGCLTSIMLTYYCGLMIKSGISDQDAYNNRAFGGFLVLVNGILLLVVMPFTLLMQLRILKKVIVNGKRKAAAAMAARRAKKELRAAHKRAITNEKRSNKKKALVTAGGGKNPPRKHQIAPSDAPTPI